MTFITACPSVNVNPLSPNGFLLSIKKLPELSYSAQIADLPEISMGYPDVGNPLQRFSVPGEQIEWGSFNLQFLVDENMSNYEAIFKWMQGLGFPESSEQYSDLLDRNSERTENYKLVSDGVFQILGSNNVAVKSFIFYDMFPISLGTLQFNTTNIDVPYLIGNVTFRYSYFTM